MKKTVDVYKNKQGELKLFERGSYPCDGQKLGTAKFAYSDGSALEKIIVVGVPVFTLAVFIGLFVMCLWGMIGG